MDEARTDSRLTSLFLAALLCVACASPAPETTTTPEGPDMTQPQHVHHAIDYIEITVRDMAEGQRFFSEAFGWEFTDYGPDYAGIRKGDGESGGLRSDVDPIPGGALIVLYSDDLEASFESVTRAGGEIEKPIFDFPGGRRFEFRDPSGNRLAVWGHAEAGEVAAAEP